MRKRECFFGGLANIFEKSLGSSVKGDTSHMMKVYKYSEPVTAKSFVFADTPGSDPVSVSGQIAGSANLIAFATGRGSMFGSKPAPCVKLATNSPMFHRLEEDMDINCGEILDGIAAPTMNSPMLRYLNHETCYQESDANGKYYSTLIQY